VLVSFETGAVGPTENTCGVMGGVPSVELGGLIQPLVTEVLQRLDVRTLSGGRRASPAPPPNVNLAPPTDCPPQIPPPPTDDMELNFLRPLLPLLSSGRLLDEEEEEEEEEEIDWDGGGGGGGT